MLNDFISQKTSFWIIIDHPQQLATALPIAECIKEKYERSPKLLLSRHTYWDKVKPSEYKKSFSGVEFFERLDFPPYTMPLWKQVAASILLFSKLVIQKLKVAKLDIKDGDIILELATAQYLSNLILSRYKKTKRIGVIPAASYECSKQKIDFKIYSYPLGSFITRYVIQPLIGIYRICYLVRKSADKRSDGVLVVRYEKNLEEIYDIVLVMTNLFDDLDVYNKKKRGKQRWTYYPCLNTEAKGSGQEKKKIVFFGQPFVDVQNISSDIYAKKLNFCLDSLRNLYSRSYRLIYRPHPREGKEISLLNLSSFKVEKDGILAELYFRKEKSNIHAAFSVCSTASRYALNYGINSYVFLPIFSFRKESRKYFEDLFGNVPKEFFIGDLKTKPKPLNLGNRLKESWEVFKDDLDWALLY